jgi:hypothetical protein
MNLESLREGDSIFVTNIDGQKHKADFIEFTNEGIFVNFKGFGNLEVKWADVSSIETFMKEQKKDNSYGPRYKVLLWQR